MRSSQETYCKVADRCSEYKAVNKDTVTNSASNKSNTDGCDRSCQTCTHFASDEHCRLDLYDQIVKSL